MLRVVGSGIEREATLRGHELAVAQERRLAPVAGAPRRTTQARDADGSRSSSCSSELPSETAGAHQGDKRLEIGKHVALGDERDDAHAPRAVPPGSLPRAPAPRRSQAWAASRSSTATIPAPSSHISASRRAASGAIDIRSSIPSACVVETTSSDTGAARSRASAASAWIAMPCSLSALSASPPRSPNPSGRPVTLDCRSFNARSHALVSAGASASRAMSSALARGSASKFPTERMVASSTTTSGLDWAALSSICDLTAARTRAHRAPRRAPAAACGTRGDPAAPAARARRPRGGASRRASVAASPGVRPNPGDRTARGRSDWQAAPRSRARPRCRERRAGATHRGARAHPSRSRARSGSAARSPRPEPAAHRRSRRPRGRPSPRDRSHRSSRGSERSGSRSAFSAVTTSSARSWASDCRSLRERVRQPQRGRADDVVRGHRAVADEVLAEDEPVVARPVDRRCLADAEPRGHAIGRAALGDEPRPRSREQHAMRSSADSARVTSSRSRATRTTSSSVRSEPVRTTVIG